VAQCGALLALEDDAMLHIFICPECRTEHDEPAEADFLLSAICVDCAFELDVRAARFEPLVTNPAAA